MPWLNFKSFDILIFENHLKVNFSTWILAHAYGCFSLIPLRIEDKFEDPKPEKLCLLVTVISCVLLFTFKYFLCVLVANKAECKMIFFVLSFFFLFSFFVLHFSWWINSGRDLPKQGRQLPFRTFCLFLQEERAKLIIVVCSNCILVLYFHQVLSMCFFDKHSKM